MGGSKVISSPMSVSEPRLRITWRTNHWAAPCRRRH